MGFDFTFLRENDIEASEFFRGIGVTYPLRARPVELLQAIYVSYRSLDGSTVLQNRFRSDAGYAFRKLTGERLRDAAARYDPNTTFDEGATNMMPRKQKYASAAKDLNMLSADELLMRTTEGMKRRVLRLAGGINSVAELTEWVTANQTVTTNQRKSVVNTWRWMRDHSRMAESIDANTFELIGHSPFGATDELVDATTDIPNTTDAVSVIAVDDTGNIVIGGNTEPVGVNLKWFTDASQSLLNQCASGEDHTVVIAALAKEFASYFSGAYEAFSFAADALTRRAATMGILETELQVAAFDSTGIFEVDNRDVNKHITNILPDAGVKILSIVIE